MPRRLDSLRSAARRLATVAKHWFAHLPHRVMIAGALSWLLGYSCRYWPSNVAWLCELLASVAEKILPV